MTESAKTGVVNHNCEVFGVGGVYIADTSIIPILPDGNTSAPAFFAGNVLANKLLRR